MSLQKEWFARQLVLAREVKLPVIVHSREAAKDTLDIMQAHHAGEIGGVVHCFSYAKEMAREYLNMDFYFGIGGVITFKRLCSIFLWTRYFWRRTARIFRRIPTGENAILH